MSSGLEDFDAVINRRRAAQAEAASAQRTALSAEAEARKKRFLRAADVGKQVASLALERAVAPDIALVSHERRRGFWRTKEQRVPAGGAWLLVLERHEITPSQGEGRNVINYKTTYQYDGLLLTTEGNLCRFGRNPNPKVIDIKTVGDLLKSAAHNDWDVPTLDYGTTHGLDAVEAGLADFIINHELELQPPEPS